MAKVELVSFDIGNTIIWSEDFGFCQRFRHACGKSIQEIGDLIIKYFLTQDISMEEAVVAISREIGFKKHTSFLHTYRIPRISIYHDVLPTLKTLKQMGIPVITMSNCTPWEQGNLDQFGIKEYIKEQFYSFKVGAAKPDQQFFRYVQDKLEIAPEKIVHIGDSWNADVQGAIASGWDAIYISRNPIKASTVSKNSHVVSSLSEVPILLA